jgi:NHS family xanthosine MFS transporter
LITVGNYWFGTKVGVVLNLGGIFNSRYCVMPALTGIIADRWINEKLYGILHILSGFAIFYIPQVDDHCFLLGNIGYDVLYDHFAV